MTEIEALQEWQRTLDGYMVMWAVAVAVAGLALSTMGLCFWETTRAMGQLPHDLSDPNVCRGHVGIGAGAYL
jgi:hypothetical protein